MSSPDSLLSRLVRTVLALGLITAFGLLRADEEEPDPAVVGEVREVGLMPSLVTELPSRDFDVDGSPLVVDLREHFTIPGVDASQLAQIKTSLGTINVELLAADAPLTVANFKSYLATDATSKAAKLKTYDGTFIHRAAENRTWWGELINEFVLQGGGYRPKKVPGGINLVEIEKKDPVQNEFKVANTRGTIAMAKRGPTGDNPPTPETINSATSEWFINLHDNRETLGTGQNGGFTVFARVLGKGMDVADAIAELPTYNLGGAFNEIPLRDVKPAQTKLLERNLVSVETIRMVPLQPPSTGKGASVLTYTVSNDNPSAANVTLVNGQLTVKPGKFGGRSILTIRAVEAGGGYAETTLETTRVGPPRLVKALPAVTKAALGDTVHIHADITAWPLQIKWQRRAPGASEWIDLAEGGPFSGVDTQDLFIDLAADTPEEAGAALDLDRSQFRFVVSNTINGVARTLEGKPTTLKVIPTLSFQDKLPKTITAALGTTSVKLTARATFATLPAPTYQWERKAPGSKVWEPLVNASDAVPATDDEPEIPAVRSPYSGVNTHTLTIRLDGTTPPSATGISVAETVALNKSQYRCVITHDRGSGPISVASTVATLRVTTLRVGFKAQPPQNVVGVLGSNASVSVTSLPVAANTPVSYQWQRLPAGQNPKIADNWIPLVNSTGDAPTRYTGVTTRTLTISLAGADETAKADALALNGDRYRCVITNALGSATSTPAQLRVLAKRFTYATQESMPLPGLTPGDGVTFKATGVPKGLVLNADGTLSGTPTAKPGTYKITVTIRTDGVVTGTLVYYVEIRALSGNVIGKFEALLSPDENSPHSGKLALTVSANGTFTGTLVTAKDKSALPLKGAFVRDAANGTLSLAAPVTIKRAGQPAGHVYMLTAASITNAGVLSATLERIDGAEADAITEGVTDAGVRLASYSSSNPAPWAYMGVYNLALTEPTPLAEDDDLALIPLGSGYARAPINAAGRLNITGKLPDGAPFTAKLDTGVGATYRLFARPYGSASGAFVSSNFKLTSITATYPRNGGTATFTRYSLADDAGQDSYWCRPAGITKPAGYTAGFGPLGFDLKLQPWIFFYGNNLGFTFTDNNTIITTGVVFDGEILGEDDRLPDTLRLNAAKLTFSDNAPPDPSQLTLKLAQATGKVTGSLLLADGRKVTLEGIYLVPSVSNYLYDFAAGTVTAEGMAIIPAPEGSSDGPTTERFRLHQEGAHPDDPPSS